MSIITSDILERRSFTVRDYYRMAEAGILDENERVELLEGEIVDMTPIGPEHSGVVDFLNKWLAPLGEQRAIVRVQNPVRLGVLSEPQPDLLLLKARHDFYKAGQPKPKDVLLLIEVSDVSLAKDRKIKLPLYARAGIPEVWIIDLQSEVVSVHRNPRGDTYTKERRYKSRGKIAPAAFPEHFLSIARLFS